jgi:uncharacterized protein
MQINTKKVVLFIGITFLVNYSLLFVYLGLGGKWDIPGSLIVSTIYMVIPGIVAFLVQKVIYKESLKKLGVVWKFNWWFLVAWLLPVVISLMTLSISIIFPGVEYSPEMAGLLEKIESNIPSGELGQLQADFRAAANSPIHPILIGVVISLIAGITPNSIAGFGEELGWRGLLQKELYSLGFWRSSVAIGFTWGVWHAPLILQGHNYDRHPQIGVLMMTLSTILLSPIFSYIRLKAKSVIATSILHGTINATAGLSTSFIKGGNDLTVGITGLAGFVSLIIVILILSVYNRLLSRGSNLV